jgi:hypothetical protein
MPGPYPSDVPDRAQGGLPAIVTAAVCSKLSRAGLSTTRSAAARAYSANEPK